MKHIDVYKTIYNVDLVVANKDVTIKDIQKKYVNPNDSEYTEDDDCIAYTSAPLKDRKTNQPVILIRYCRDSKITNIDKRLDFINTIGHEAIHAAMFIYSKIGEKVFVDDSNELLSYLVGWIAECIYKTWTKK